MDKEIGVEEINQTPSDAPTNLRRPRIFSRRKLITKSAATGVSASVVGTVLSSQENIPLPFIPLNYEGIVELGVAIRFPAETVENGVRVIPFGDSILLGYQGTHRVNGKTVDKPYTPPAKYVVDDQRAKGRNWTLELYAVQGETGAQTLARIKEFRKKEYLVRLDAKRNNIPFDPRPLWIWHSDNGNYLRIPASKPKINASAKKLDRDGPLKHPQEFGEVTEAMSDNTKEESDNILASFLEIRDMAEGIPPEGVDEKELIPVPVVGIEVLLTYDKAEVPTMQFIPIHTTTKVTRRNIAFIGATYAIKKIFNLARDGMARWAAHIGSQQTINAYKHALQRFRLVAGKLTDKTAAISMEPFVKYNNGTEHLNPTGDRLVANCVETHTEVMDNGEITTLYDYPSKVA